MERGNSLLAEKAQEGRGVLQEKSAKAQQPGISGQSSGERSPRIAREVRIFSKDIDCSRKANPGTGGNEKGIMTVWDERFAVEDYVYEKDPNDFLVSIINKRPNYVRN